MPATITVSADGTYLLQTVIGVHTPQMQRTVMRELFAQMERTGLRKVLVDARVQQAPIPALDVYAIWEELAPQVPRGAKFAIFVNWELKGLAFSETVAVNRRVNIRFFNDEDRALAWLGVVRDGE